MIAKRPVLILLLSLCLAPPAAGETAKLGHQLTALAEPVLAHDFTLPDMDDEPHTFSDYRGKVIIVNFWATWCPPCRREMPSLERVYQQFNRDNFTVLAVNQMENADHVFAYIGQLDVDPTFTILFDENSVVSQAFNVKGLPTTYLVDKQGLIRYRAIGGREFDHPEVEKQIQRLLEE